MPSLEVAPFCTTVTPSVSNHSGDDLTSAGAAPVGTGEINAGHKQQVIYSLWLARDGQ